MGRRRRITVAVLILPITIPFFLFWRFMEWFHFKASGRALGACRAGVTRLQQFFDAL